MKKAVVGMLFACGAVLLAPLGTAMAQENPYAENYFRMLTDRGIATDADGLRTFLSGHIPGPEDAARLQQQLADLGDDEYAKREAAMQALLARPPQSLEAIEKLAASSDPEVRWRARLVIDSLRQPGNDLLYASLIVIHSRKIGGLAEQVLGVAPLCQSDSMQLAMSRALLTTATAKDSELLKKSLSSEDHRVRTACLNALMLVQGEAAVPLVLPLLEDKSDLVRFEAAIQLLKFRRADSLRTLGKLLLSEQLTVRNRSIHALRTNLKVSLPYSGYEPAEDRARHAADWQKSIEANIEKPEPMTSATTSSFRTKLVLQSPRSRGLILVGHDGNIQAKELEWTGGRVVALENGNLLTVRPDKSFVFETDGEDKEVWKSSELDERPLFATRKKDGVTLVATAEGSLIELNASGDMIRKAVIGTVVDIAALPNGDVLLLSFVDSRLKQVDVAGRIGWQITLPARPTSMCLTSDGHVLIALQGEAALVDLDLETKQQKRLPTPFRSLTQIEQLEDGRLAIVDAAGAHFADRNGALTETIKLFAGTPDVF